MKKYIPLSVLVLSLVFLTGCAKIVQTNNNSNATNTEANEPAAQSSTAISGSAFFDDSSPVMMFYSDQCGWCQKEKTVLDGLATSGYRVKPMDVGKNQDYWKKYSVDGTPTFIAANGEKLVGYKEKADLQAWFDSHGAKIK